jgi:large subunit ribosomal protein L6
MSRIGKLPVTVPAGVQVKVSDENVVIVKGPLGELSQKVDPNISVSVENGTVELKGQAMKKARKQCTVSTGL